jgi:hypothetical protein
MYLGFFCTPEVDFATRSSETTGVSQSSDMAISAMGVLPVVE